MRSLQSRSPAGRLAATVTGSSSGDWPEHPALAAPRRTRSCSAARRFCVSQARSPSAGDGFPRCDRGRHGRFCARRRRLVLHLRFEESNLRRCRQNLGGISRVQCQEPCWISNSKRCLGGGSTTGHRGRPTNRTPLLQNAEGKREGVAPWRSSIPEECQKRRTPVQSKTGKFNLQAPIAGPSHLQTRSSASLLFCECQRRSPPALL